MEGKEMDKMENALRVFEYGKSQIRTVLKDNEPWFVGKDIARALGYERTRDAIHDHVDVEDKISLSNLDERRITTRVNGLAENTVMINESGMYSLIFASQLPTAKKFKRWVTSEVLPDIRKHGMYLSDKAMEVWKNDPQVFDRMLEMYEAEREANNKLREEADKERPFAVLGHAVYALSGSMTVKDFMDSMAQKGIPIGQNTGYKWLRENNYVCGRKGRQYNKPTKKSIKQGLLNVSVSENDFHSITMVTPKGALHFSNKLFEEYMPLVFLMEKVGTEECIDNLVHQDN